MNDPESFAKLVIERSTFYDVFKKTYFEHALDDAYDRGQVISNNDGEVILLMDHHLLLLKII